MERTTVTVTRRDGIGTTAARKIRQQGLVPAIVYGQGREPVPVSVNRRDLHHAIRHSEGGLNTILDLVVDGAEPTAAIIKEVQSHPVKGDPVHIDFLTIRTDRPIQQSVPVALIGQSPGVAEGGVLSEEHTTLTIEGLPRDIPPEIPVDISGLTIGHNLRAGEVPMPAGMTLIDDPDLVVVSIIAPMGEEAEAPAAEGEPGAGEAAPAADEAGGDDSAPSDGEGGGGEES